ncbi:hypothetical protein P7C73_g5614, partial [Tremellales sp. Uapishka_1]
MIPRSPAGLLTGDASLADESMGRSFSGLSSSSAGTSPHPQSYPIRRSTDNLDYYFSSAAGAGASSSSSSLANSLGFGSPPAVEHQLEVGPGGDHPRPPIHHYSSSDSSHSITAITNSHRKYGLISIGSKSSLQELSGSPGGYSPSSSYSIPEHVKVVGKRRSVSSMYSDVGAESKRPLMMDSETGDQEWDRGTDSRLSMTSGTTYRGDEQSGDSTALKTPMPPAFHERHEIHPPTFGYTASPTRSNHSRTTPTRPAHQNSASPTGSIPTSHGRLAFVAPPDIPRQSLDALERDIAAQDMTGRMAITVDGRERERETPSSAPAWKSEFGVGMDEDEGEATLKGRKRSTLPVTASVGASALVEAMLSPEKYDGRGTPRGKSEDRNRNPSPAPSPEPPPRSTLRKQHMPPLSDLHSFASSPDPSQRTLSPKLSAQTVPTIINTPNSPDPSPPAQAPIERSASLVSSATINDLTEMLGGAIDAIGLIDSRDTPPPNVVLPSSRDKPKLSPLMLQPAAQIDNEDRGPITPTTLPPRNASLPGIGPPASPAPSFSNTRRSTHPEPIRKTSSILSIRSASFTNSPTTFANPAAKPWPAAMLFGHVKTMKTAGDRSKGYARGINELARAESGLREWCLAAGTFCRLVTASRPPLMSQIADQTHRPIRATSKMSPVASLGLRSPTYLEPYTTHSRQVSAASEFPLRADSYTAREISVRNIDPMDQPTALPPNLPYPQLQQQHLMAGTGGMKPSPSMQSVVSVGGTSSKKGFFSNIGRRGSGKKETTGLGPPGSGAGMAAKKDVRGLPISGPSPGSASSPQRSDSNGLVAPKVQSSISAPMGPRGPRMGSFTPPPSTVERMSTESVQGRASLDQGLSRMHVGRGSLDGSAASRNGSVGGGKWSLSPVKDDELSQMGDILPHVERGVLRKYLQTYGDQMNAIGAYLEDETKGKVLN